MVEPARSTIEHATPFDAALFERIVQHGMREFPNECCGLVAGRDGRPVEVFEMRNADASPASYRLDPKEQLEVTQRIEDEGLELWAVYHSHTHSEAYPSETDRDRAGWVQPFYPDIRYLLLSLQDRDHPVLRSYRIADGEVTEEELTVT